MKASGHASQPPLMNGCCREPMATATQAIIIGNCSRAAAFAACKAVTRWMTLQASVVKVRKMRTQANAWAGQYCRISDIPPLDHHHKPHAKRPPGTKSSKLLRRCRYAFKIWADNIAATLCMMTPKYDARGRKTCALSVWNCVAVMHPEATLSSAPHNRGSTLFCRHPIHTR